MNTDQLMNEATAAVDRRAIVLAKKILKDAHEGASAESLAKQIAHHIKNVELPAAAVLFADMDAFEAAKR